MVLYMEGELHQEGKGHLYYGRSAIAGDIRNDDAPGLRGGDIDHIVPRGGDADVPQLWQLCEGCGGERRFVGEHRSGAGAASGDGGHFVGSAIIYSQLSVGTPGIPGEVAGIQGVAVDCDYFHT